MITWRKRGLRSLDNRRLELCKYRMAQAKESLKASEIMQDNGMIKDSINRSYYAAFYAIKAVLALDEVDFKRHKDVVAYFNREYVAKERFSRELGRKISRLQQLREKSDYDDFFIASVEQAKQQLLSAESVINETSRYLSDVMGIV